MRKVCFTAVDDRHYYPEGTHIFINSFKKFHPDIDLVVFRQDAADKLFKEKGIDWYNCKPYFAQLLEDKYDLIVNMDADHVVCGRMSEVFDNVDYEVAGPWNFNDYENASFENITEEMYIQCGMWATTSHDFLKVWRSMNLKAREYKRRENDVMNLVVYNSKPGWKLKIVDKDKDYYGCKSLGREPEFYVEGDRLMCRNEQVVAYHFARGGVFPKLDFDSMPLTDEVRKWLHKLSYGQTVKMVSV